MNSTKARVLVADNDPRAGRYLKEILETVGYQVKVAQGVGRRLVDDAVGIGLDFRPHVAIVDLRISGSPAVDTIRSDDYGGTELLRRLEQARCILRSAFLTPEATRLALKEFGAFDVVGAEKSPRELLEAVRAATQEMCATARGFEIRWPAPWSAERVVEVLLGQETAVPPDVVEDVISRAFPGSESVKLQKLEGAATTPGPVSRGRSVVLKAWLPNRITPLVLKLATAKNVVEESRNYYDYILGNIGGMFHARLEGEPITFWDLGGILYSFVGEPRQSLSSFATFYRQHQDPQFILPPLRHFFEKVWGDLYREVAGERHLEGPGVARPLFQSYDKMLRLEERLLSLPGREEEMTFPGVDRPLPNPVSWVLRHKDDSAIPCTRHAVTHGDLHGDNLFVDEDHAWAIDFERAGPGHILRDFVELEVDIVTRLVSLPGARDSLLPFCELVTILAAPLEPSAPFRPTPRLLADPETRKALGVTAELRRLAHDVTRYTDAREYVWGLLLDALFVSTLVSEGSPQRERALLLASVLCARLQSWGNQWPPEDWR